jgi:transposase-like protein
MSTNVACAGTATPSPSLSEIAAAVLRAEGQHGRIAELAQAHGVDRRTLYRLRERAKEALAEEFAEPAQNEGIAVEPLDERPDDHVLFNLPVTVGLRKRSMIALRVVAPASERDIVALLPILYGEPAALSYGKVQSVLIEAGRRAAERLGDVNLANVDCAILDEMFSQRRPVLGGLDAATQFLFLLQVNEGRSGEDWSKVLNKLRDERDLKPERIVKDAGTGLAKGCTTSWPEAEQRDDLFHAKYAVGKALSYLERRAEGAITKEYEQEQRRMKGNDEAARRRTGQDWRQAKVHADEAIERFDRFDRLSKEATQLLKLTPRGSGVLYTPEEVRAGLERVGEAMMQVGGQHAHKAGRYLRNRAAGLSTYLRALAEELSLVTEAAGGEALVRAATRLYEAAMDLRPARRTQSERRAVIQEFDVAFREFHGQAGGDSVQVRRTWGLVAGVLEQRQRASSAIENLNSVLRPYLVVHKNVEQNFLDLFRYYWNFRIREWGRGKGTSAYQQLTGTPVPDWLGHLGYPVSKATGRLAA